MSYKINSFGISGLNNMRMNSLNRLSSNGSLNYLNKNKSAVNGNRLNVNSAYQEKLQYLNKLFGLNTVKIDGKNKDNKAVEVLSVNLNESKSYEDKILNLKIGQLAQGQKNSSLYLIDKSKDIRPDSYEFQISSKDKAFKIKVDVNQEDTNENVFNKISSAVNSLNCGVKGEVTKDKNGKVDLGLISTETGSKAGFKVLDLQGDIISKLKLNYADRLPSDAVYSVNGKIYQNSKNEISLENDAIKLKLNSIGNYTVDINKKRCYDDIQSNINEITSNTDYLVAHYNNKMGSLAKNSFTYEKLVNELKMRQSSFNNIGIETSKNSTMKFQDKLFRNLARSNPDLLMSSMTSPKGVLNFFDMVKSSDLDTPSSLYGGRGKSFGLFNRGTLLDYL